MNCVEGLPVIRTLDTDSRVLRQFDLYQDRLTAASYMVLATTRWVALRLDAVSVVLVTLVPLLSIVVIDGRQSKFFQ